MERYVTIREVSRSAEAAGGPAKRGRLPAAERRRREAEILAVAARTLDEVGYEALTMQDVADRAHASKQTLYAWFGTREDLLAALIARNADRVAERVAAMLLDHEQPTEAAARGVLERYAAGQLTLLTGTESVNLNRAAMTSPRLAELLLDGGRHTVGPLVGRYLRRLIDTGLLRDGDTDDYFRLLYGLVIADDQIRVLLGEPAPGPEVIATRAAAAVDRFWALVGAR